MLEKEKTRTNKAERENSEFKQWICHVLGRQRVVEGSEKILLK